MKKLWILMLVFMMIGVVPVTAAADGISLTATKSALAKWETAELRITSSDGTARAVGEDAVFSSSDPSVVTVDENGTMTAVGEGLSFVSVIDRGMVSKPLGVIVYHHTVSDRSYDAEPLGMTAAVLSSAQDASLKFRSSVEIVAGGHEADNIGRSRHYLQLDRATMGVDNYAKGSGWSSTSNYIYEIFSPAVSGQSDAPLKEIWFYDDGLVADGQFWIAQIPNADPSYATDVDLRYAMTFRSGVYQFYAVNNSAKRGFSASSFARSKGWHQLLWDAREEQGMTLYLDGAVIARTVGSACYTDHAIPSFRYDRFISPQTTPGAQQMKIDSATVYDLTPTYDPGKPISGIYVQADRTALSPGEEGELTVYGIAADGDVPLTEGWSVSSDRLTTVSVDADGHFHALQPGTALLTVRYNDSTAGVVITVGGQREKISYAQWPVTDLITTQNTGYRVSDSYEITTALTHTDGEPSLYEKPIAQTMCNEAFLQLQSGGYYFNHSLLDRAVAQGESAELWFYDTMESRSGDNWIWLDSDKVNNFHPARGYLSFDAEQYTFHPLFYEGTSYPGYADFTCRALPRSKGWHRLYLDCTRPGEYIFSIDGVPFAEKLGDANGLSSVCLYRNVYPPLMGTADNGGLYFADAARYTGFAYSGQSLLEQYGVNAISLEKTMAFNNVGAYDTVRVTAHLADGRSASVTGDPRLTYEVGDPSVITVTDEGRIHALKTGASRLAVTAHGADGTIASASVIMAVGNATTNRNNMNNGRPLAPTNAQYEYSEEIRRAGAQSYHMVTAHAWNSMPVYANTTAGHSFVFTGWLYDEGIGSSSAPRFEIGSTNRAATDPETGAEVTDNRNFHSVMGVAATGDRYYSIMNNPYKRQYWAPGASCGSAQAGNWTGCRYTAGLLDGNGATAFGSFTDPVTGTVTTYGGEKVPAVPRSKGWHQFAVVCDGGGTEFSNVSTPNGKMEWYLDGQLILTDRYVPNYCYLMWPVGTGYISDYQVTHFTAERRAPEVTGVTVTGEGRVGALCRATAEVTDPNGYGQESVIGWNWQSSSDGEAWSSVSETAEHTVGAQEAGKLLRVTATPAGTIDGLTGEPRGAYLFVGDAYPWGDVNRDGSVNAADAILILGAEAGLYRLPLAAFPAADTDHNGAITCSDALEVLRFDSGLTS